MKCISSENISAYLDNELKDKERSAVESHLRGCAHCAGALGEMRSLRNAFKGTARHEAPYGFSSRVLAGARDLDKKRSPWFVPVLLKFAEAAVILVVIAVGIIAGKAVTNGSSTPAASNVASSFSLDMFEATPPGSLGEVYLAMTEAGNEQ
jgi:anti-sigma factor RsiW